MEINLARQFNQCQLSETVKSKADFVSITLSAPAARAAMPDIDSEKRIVALAIDEWNEIEWQSPWHGRYLLNEFHNWIVALQPVGCCSWIDYDSIWLCRLMCLARTRSLESRHNLPLDVVLPRRTSNHPLPSVATNHISDSCLRARRYTARRSQALAASADNFITESCSTTRLQNPKKLLSPLSPPLSSCLWWARNWYSDNLISYLGFMRNKYWIIENIAFRRNDGKTWLVTSRRRASRAKNKSEKFGACVVTDREEISLRCELRCSFGWQAESLECGWMVGWVFYDFDFVSHCGQEI